MLTSQEVACLRACSECAAACLQCMSDCLSDDHKQALDRCISLDMECAESCRLAISSIALGSHQMDAACARCADACLACAAEYAKHTLKHCQRCAESCRKCAANCHAMVRRYSAQPVHTSVQAMA